MQDFIKELNEVQQKAVLDIEGPSLVIAGAGSGKTRVLTYRIAHLLSQDVKAGSILALTFTNKAAKEMRERVASLVGNHTARNLWMGTFHSIFSRILRSEAELLGFPSTFTIYDTQDSKNLLKAIIKEMNLDDKVYKPNVVLNRISGAKNNLVTAAAYGSNAQIAERDRSAKIPYTAEIYKRYTNRCKRAGAMDFDDLLLNTNVLFRDHPDVLARYQNIFKYVMVDEYQDTNFSQYLIVKKLAANHNNVCVVGDDAQSIYSFRGAKIENILNFKNDYPNYTLHKLEQNYRSTQTIVNAANSVIDKNKGQIRKETFSANEEGEKIKVFKAMTDIEESYIVANSITDTHLSEQAKFLDFAILYRTNAQSRAFEEALRKRNIPYKIYGGLSFYQRKEIKDLLAYFRVIANPRDSEALKRIINYPARGIGKTTFEKLDKCTNTTNASLWEVVKNIRQFEAGLNVGTVNKLVNFASLINSFGVKLKELSAYDLAYMVASETGILKELHVDKSPEGVSRYENIQEILNSIQEFVEDEKEATGETVTLDKYLENVALLTDQDTEKAEDRDKITLMTVHSAKGLEFKYIYIVGLEEELFPSSMSSGSAQELEEERRLFYVAITRAEKRASISFATSRYKWGTPTFSKPSRFIREIDAKYLDLPNELMEDEDRFASFEQDSPSTSCSGFTKGSSLNKAELSGRNFKSTAKSGFIKRTPVTSRSGGLDFKASSPSELQIGMKVEHVRFGLGKIVNLEGAGVDIKATVDFKAVGQKQLLLKFAKLRIVK